MSSSRMVVIAASGVAALLTLAAVWLIIESPGTIDDVAPYQEPAASPGEAVAVSVREGEGPGEIGDRLERLRVIDSATQFQVLVALMGLDRSLQAGEYEFARGTPALDVIYRMRDGLVTTRGVTVVEGWRIEQIADVVAAEGIDRAAFIAAASGRAYDFDFVQEVPEGQPLEGYLFPATYSIRASDTPESLVQRMLAAFEENLPVGVRDAAAARELTLHEVVTLASIIEREAVVPEERPVMAQVFLTRLRIGIALGADPTVQYAVAQDAASVADYGYWKEGLTVDDLALDSPYNTYVYFGLPPGPICSPGLDAIIAVVQPADTNYLYFVAKPDGSHAFAETLEEHEANVEMYAR